MLIESVRPSSEGRMASKEILSSSSSLKRPSVSLSSRFIRSSSVQGQLDRRTDSRERGRDSREDGNMYISHSKTGERSLLSSSSSVLSPNCPRVRRLPLIHFLPSLPSPLPPRRCRHHISWPQKGICSRERIRPPPSSPLCEKKGPGKAKRAGASEGFRSTRSSHPRI